MPPYPQKNYQNFAQLASDINTEVITNGRGGITGVIGNNILNGLLKFIEQSPLNWATASQNSGSNPVVAGTGNTIGPVIMFTGLTPSSLSWIDNIYNQYVFINATANSIPLVSGFMYFDSFLNPQVSVPANQAVVIFKTLGGQWVQANNAASAGNVPDPTNAAGEFLTNNGAIAFWSNTYLKLQPSGFASPTVYANGALAGRFFDLYVNDIPKFLQAPEDPVPEWSYNIGGGFTVILPGLNLQTLTTPIYLFFKSNPA
jgi:hypothetical protein